uniref:Uncharacterized protein n=1 Tax=Anguilla anguilla TaxID=7936 RepID=A0A0E9XDR6_ANGAN
MVDYGVEFIQSLPSLICNQQYPHNKMHLYWCPIGNCL